MSKPDDFHDSVIASWNPPGHGPEAAARLAGLEHPPGPDLDSLMVRAVAGSEGRVAELEARVRRLEAANAHLTDANQALSLKVRGQSGVVADLWHDLAKAKAERDAVIAAAYYAEADLASLERPEFFAALGPLLRAWLDPFGEARRRELSEGVRRAAGLDAAPATGTAAGRIGPAGGEGVDNAG